MSTSTETYRTDVAYPAHFHREMMPQWLHACSTSLGMQAPAIDASFTWLELGCGSASNLLAAAANYPHARFVGIDLSEREIQQGQQWAQASGLHNIELLCADMGATATVAELQQWLSRHAAAMPPQTSASNGFDYIVSHGVYSWVSPAVRDAMHQLIAQCLAPQGLVYLAYNSQPGAASLSATQRLMRLNAQRLSGSSSAAQVRDSLSLIMALAQGGAGNYVEQPALLRELERLNGLDENYLAHEFLNAHWHAHHVSDVMQALATAGCRYIGSATAIENINALSLPAKLHGIFTHMQSQAMDSAQIETAKDIARNQNQRRDLYQQGLAPLSETAHRQQLLAQQLVALPAAQAAKPTAQASAIALPTRIGTVELPVSQVQPIFDALQSGSQSYADLAQLPAHRNHPGGLNALLQALAWAGWVEFVQLSSTDEAQHVAQRVQRLRQTLKSAGLHELAERVPCLIVAAEHQA